MPIKKPQGPRTYPLRRLSGAALNGDDIYRMMKCRLRDFNLPRGAK
jgi:hypothetical protein